MLYLEYFQFMNLYHLLITAMPFIKDLRPYFEKHTLLAAALIAGFVGAMLLNQLYYIL